MQNQPKSPTIRLSGFSLEVLDTAAPTEDWSVAETVERAVRQYVEDRERRPPGWACLPLPEGSRDREDAAAVDIPVADSTFGAISAEAEAQGVTLEVVVTHAVMYLWAGERPPVATPARDEGEGAGDQAARRGATTGVAPSLASDPRRLSRPR